MSFSVSFRAFAVVVIGAALSIPLAACGGGGGDDSSSSYTGDTASVVTPSGETSTDANTIQSLTYSTDIQARWSNRTFTIYYDSTNEPATMRPNDPNSNGFLPAEPTNPQTIDGFIQSAIDQWNAACPGMHAVYGGRARAGMNTNTISWIKHLDDPELGGEIGDLGATYPVTDPTGKWMQSANIKLSSDNITVYATFSYVIAHELGHAYGMILHTAYQDVPGDPATDSIMDVTNVIWHNTLHPGDLMRCAKY